jgi:hypothetical protein
MSLHRQVISDRAQPIAQAGSAEGVLRLQRRRELGHHHSPAFLFLRTNRPKRVSQKVLLQARHFCFERQPARSEMQHVNTSILFVGLPIHKTLVNQLPKRPMKTLSGHPQDTDQVGDRQRLPTSDEVQDPVVHAPERKLGEIFVRAGDQAAVREEEEFKRGIKMIDPSRNFCRRIRSSTSFCCDDSHPNLQTLPRHESVISMPWPSPWDTCRRIVELQPRMFLNISYQ